MIAAVLTAGVVAAALMIGDLSSQTLVAEQAAPAPTPPAPTQPVPTQSTPAPPAAPAQPVTPAQPPATAPISPTPPAAPEPIQPAPTPAVDGLSEVFPGVHLDVKKRLVEFEAQISPMLVKDPKAPSFFLEVVACSPNSREHETLVVSRVKPSHIHAAMLAIGLKPAAPGSWTLKDGKLVSTAPTGDRVTIRFIYTGADKKPVEADPLDWIISSKDARSFMDAQRKQSETDKLPPPGWIFAGSKFVKRGDKSIYDADGAGTIIGLTTFGSELIAFSRVISPDAGVEEPQWIVDFAKVPPADTKVRVRITAAE